MVVYYFGCGLVAVIALLLNSLLLMGAMALNHAAFTLPGIAGVILTFGMAVDANVLVYERMREEFQRGEDLRTAVRLGYEKALSAIVDGNLTTLIVCVVLGFTGTPEIKGFALTLGIGLVTTLFSQLFFTRLLFTLLVEKVRIRRLSMLPLAVPLVQRLFSLNIDWLKFRGLWYAVSFFFVGLGVMFIAVEGRELLAAEFRGGTAVTIQTRKGEDGRGIRMTRAEVAERVKRIAAEAPPGSPLVALTHAEVSVVNPDPGGVRSDTFTIKSLLTNAELMQSSVAAAFADVLDVRPPLTFKGSGAGANRGAPVFAVVSVSLGESLDRPAITERVDRDFLGALAVLLEDIQPTVSRREIEDRIAQTRAKSEFADTAGRVVRVLTIEGTDEAVRSAVVLVQDRGLSHFDDEPRWNENVRDREWALIQAALTQTQSLASVQSFGSSIAATFRANAITAVLISGLLVVVYIWVRFGSFRYSAAAIATTSHDCFVAIGMVGAAAWVYHELPDVAARLMILPFKIDLNVIAAILTILGYSLNDTIVVMDRIRENRGKLPYASREVINASVNQTLSRTIITGGTTFISCIVLYLIGGEGVRVFAYTMIVGIVVGTFSSIAVAAPLVWSRKADPHANDPAGRLTT
jgi:SecD/SecF fusion protein